MRNLRNIAVVAQDDGRGELFPFKLARTDHAGELFYISGYTFKIDAENRVTIPAEIMEKLGFVRKDGKRAFDIVPAAVHIKGKLTHGGFIYDSPTIRESLEDAPNGGQLPQSALRPSLKEKFSRLRPSDSDDWQSW